MSRKTTNVHHIIPRSRVMPRCDKNAQNTVVWDASYHDCWHRMFENMTVWEIHRFIDIVSKDGGHWTRRDFRSLQDKLMANRPFICNRCNFCNMPLLANNRQKCLTCGDG